MHFEMFSYKRTSYVKYVTRDISRFIFEAYLDKMCIIEYTESLYLCLCAVHFRPMYCHTALAELRTCND